MVKQAKVCVLVANSARARFFMQESPNKLTEVETLIHPESRMKDSDLVTSQQGRSFESVGSHRHAMEPPVSPHKHESIVFAKQVCDQLESFRQKGAFDRLYLIAAPSFLGLIRQNMHHALQDIVKSEIDKDMTHLTPADIAKYLLQHA